MDKQTKHAVIDENGRIDFSHLTDDELFQAADEAHEDLIKSSHDEPGSEFHEGCLAALIAYGMEAQRRGIRKLHA